jgi:hypothetical protein
VKKAKDKVVQKVEEGVNSVRSSLEESERRGPVSSALWDLWQGRR